MHNDLVSIIVPVYMTEQYIDKCLKSLVQQTYSNIEIICVDDCTSDNSIDIVREYMKSDSRIQLVRHEINSGLAEARNTGLAHSKGEYIVFVDSDDWVCRDYIEKLYELTLKYDADISVCSYARSLTWYEDIHQQTQEKIEKYSGRDAIKKMFSADKYQTDITLTVAWNKLFKREIIDGICFPKGKLYEDQPFAIKAYYNSQRVVVTNRKLYFYRKNHSSITMQRFNIRILDELDLYDDMKEFFRNNNERDILNTVVARKVPLAINRYVAALEAGDKDAMKKACHHVIKEWLHYLNSDSVTWVYKIKYLLFVLDRRIFLLYGFDLFYRE
ncbi:MAG: glycosyltransferase family 2 protein [Lachnospiraceae bacterium]|nr:glycosyltransferase family 2 protein [Lachnospiraceae bacterium]